MQSHSTNSTLIYESHKLINYKFHGGIIDEKTVKVEAVGLLTKQQRQEAFDAFVTDLVRYGWIGRRQNKKEKPGESAVFAVIERKRDELQHLEGDGFFLPATKGGVRTIVARISFEGPKPPLKRLSSYDPDKVPRHLRSYVARLSDISKFCFDETFTDGHAKAAEVIAEELDDRLGRSVDLFAQLLLVREYEWNEGFSRDYPGSSIPDHNWKQVFTTYFKFAPWEFGPDLYHRAIEEQKLSYPLLTDIQLECVWRNFETERWMQFSPVFEDACRVLGMPYTAIYKVFYLYDPDDEFINPETGEVIENEGHDYVDPADDYVLQIPDRNFSASTIGACNWQEILKSRTVEDETAKEEYIHPLAGDPDYDEEERHWREEEIWDEQNEKGFDAYAHQKRSNRWKKLTLIPPVW